MARPARIKKSNNGTARYHLMSRTNDRRFLFEKGGIKTKLVDALKRAAAFVIPADGVELKPEDVQAFCKDKISWFKIPKYVHFLDIFPMTASQKIQKYKLREMAHELWSDA